MLKPSTKLDNPSRKIGLHLYYGVVTCIENGKKIYSIDMQPLYTNKADALENAKWHISNWI